jgi:hypothetical protein
MGRLTWLGLTPEPERELPSTVAALRAARSGERVTSADVDAERRRVETLVLRGSQRGWLRYLGEVTELVGSGCTDSDATIRATARHAGAVVLEHHRMLIGLPGDGYAAAAGQRAALRAALRTTPRSLLGAA